MNMYAPIIALTLAMVSSAPAPAADQATAMQEAESVCPVTGKTILPGQGVRVTVKGRDYLVFDAEAAQALTLSPEKYLEADGTPRNARHKEGPAVPPTQ